MVKRKVFLVSFLCFCLMVGLLPGNVAVHAAYQNVSVKNPGFEEPLVNEEIPGWHQTFGKGGFSVVDTMSSSGSHSLRVQDNSSHNNPGMESEMIQITPGKTYTATAMAYVDSGQAYIYIQFFNSQKERIGHKSIGSQSHGKWEPLAATETAPEKAVYASILLYSGVSQVTEAYFDDVTLKEKTPLDHLKNVDKIGVPIRSVTVPGASYGKGPNGQDWIYAVANGSPAILSVINAHTGKRVRSFQLPGANYSWGQVVAPDGTLYIASGRHGYMYRWVPGSDKIDRLKPIPSEDHIWRMTVDDKGRIYGGTYPNGKVFQYDPATNKFRDYGPLIKGIQYVRGIAYGNGKIYAGMGTPAKLVQLDPETGAKKVIPLPEKYQDQKFVYDVAYEGKLLFVRVTPANDTLVYDVVHQKWIDVIQNTTAEDKIVSPPGPDNKVYIHKDQDLYAYDLTTHQLTSTGVKFFNGGFASRGFGWIHLSDPDYPGPSLVSMNSRGGIFIYNPSTGHHKQLKGDVEGSPNDIQSLGEGPRGNIYVGGYLSPQGVGFYNPDTGELRQLDGISQIGGMGVYKGKLYMGTYPGANIFAYDPSKPWDYGTNPPKLFSLKDHGQGRVFAFADVGNKIAIGTVPVYGELGGALTFYDPSTGKYEVHRNVVKYQSVIDLKYRDGLLYGGTSIWGGYGVNPTEKEAKLFIWDVAKGKKVWEGVPVPGEEAVSALTFDDQGYLWGLTAGYIFKFDPRTRQVVKKKRIFPYSGGEKYYRGRGLTYSLDGYLYGITLGKLFRFNPKTWETKVLAEDPNIMLFSQDHNGDLYFARQAMLYKYDLFHVTSAAEMIAYVKRFEKEGVFANHGAAQSLTAYLETVEHFKKAGATEKAVKHLKDFQSFLKDQKENGLVSDEAYHILNGNAEDLIKKWQ